MNLAYDVPQTVVPGASLRGSAIAPATCGELIQGYLDGVDFLVNSPIDLFSTVKVTLIDEPIIIVDRPGHFPKLIRAVRMTLDCLGMDRYGADVAVISEIPRGKGLASSTSELTSAVYAAARASMRMISVEEVTRILLDIDSSTDGVFLPGITRCNHLTGQLLQSYGTPPALSFVMVDSGGEVETSSFDRTLARRVAECNRTKLKMALSLLGRGFNEHSAALIAQACTISTEINQEVLLKPEFEDLLFGTREFGGLGVNCGHTGTVLGVMFDPLTTETDPIVERVSQLVGRRKILGTHSLISGGLGRERES